MSKKMTFICLFRYLELGIRVCVRDRNSGKTLSCNRDGTKPAQSFRLAV